MASKRIEILERYNELKRPLILDGAMGSLLQERGAVNDKFLWLSKTNVDNPKLVEALHKEYIDSGADIITTNTFRTNPVSLKRSGYEIDQKHFVKESVRVAIEAKQDKKIIIAGSNAPAEDCYQKERTITKYELDYNHKKHIELLWESGCDIIWNETQSHWDEIEIICRFCSNNNLPFAINLYFGNNLKLLSGEPLHEAVEFIKDFGLNSIGFNCIRPEMFSKYFGSNEMPKHWGFYFNCGLGNVTDESIVCGITPSYYIKSIGKFATEKPLFIGSCCGSSPLHTKAIKEYVDEVYRN